jgi:hypothetical protein
LFLLFLFIFPQTADDYQYYGGLGGGYYAYGALTGYVKHGEAFYLDSIAFRSGVSSSTQLSMTINGSVQWHWVFEPTKDMEITLVLTSSLGSGIGINLNNILNNTNTNTNTVLNNNTPAAMLILAVDSNNNIFILSTESLIFINNELELYFPEEEWTLTYIVM